MNKALIGKLLVTGAIVAAMGVPIAANAGGSIRGSSHVSPIVGRFARQQQRIDRGVANGELTYREYARDEARLHGAETMYHADRNDGTKLTGAERAKLRSKLNHNSTHIWFTKHDRADQPGA